MCKGDDVIMKNVSNSTDIHVGMNLAQLSESGFA